MVLAGVGVVAAVVGIVYFMVPVHLYPSWFPGHGAAKGKHRTTGAAIGLVAVVAWAGAGILAFRATKEMFGARAMLHLPGGGSAADILVPQIRFRTVNDEEGTVSPARARLVVLLAVAGLSLGAVGTLLGVVALQKGQGTKASISTAATGAVPGPATTAAGPPNVALAAVPPGTTLKGNALLHAVTTGGVSTLQWEYSGGNVRGQVNGERSPFGWIGFWDTTQVPNGTYSVVAVATGPGGVARSTRVTVAVKN